MRAPFLVVGGLALVLTATGCSSGPAPDPLVSQRSSASAASTSTPEPVATSAAADHGPADAAQGTVSGGPTTFEYTVAPGDAVAGIAGRFGLCTADVYLANQDQDVLGHELSIGQRLVIERTPGPGHDPANCEEPFPVGVS